MKGLLLKDWYMVRKYCKAYFILAIVFLLVSVMNGDNLFFAFYPCLLCGMIPVNLLGYDERSRWLQYSATLPYTRAQIVTAKYLIGLIAQLTVIAIVGIMQAVKQQMEGSFVWNDYLVLLLLLVVIATVGSSITLPFVFKLGVEKGRMAYYVMIGFICAASIISANLFQKEFQLEIRPNLFLILLAVGGIALYIFSWRMSIVFFEKREL